MNSEHYYYNWSKLPAPWQQSEFYITDGRFRFYFQSGTFTDTSTAEASLERVRDIYNTACNLTLSCRIYWRDEVVEVVCNMPQLDLTVNTDDPRVVTVYHGDRSEDKLFLSCNGARRVRVCYIRSKGLRAENEMDIVSDAFIELGHVLQELLARGWKLE